MSFPPTSRKKGNRLAIAWALASQTIWLPLILIDLNDHWSSDVAEVKPQTSVAGVDLQPSPINKPFTNSLSSKLIGASERTSNNHAGILLNEPATQPHPLNTHQPAQAKSWGSLLATTSDQSSRLEVAYHKEKTSSIFSILPSVYQNSAPSPGIPSGLISKNYTKADLLGGVLVLRDVYEVVMPPIAQAERATWKRSGDPLSPLPQPWRESIRGALHGLSPIISTGPQKGVGGEVMSLAIDMAKIVHVPSSRIRQPAQVPLALQSDGTVDILSQADDPAIIEEIRTWSSKQALPSKGRMVPAVVHLHPLPNLDQQVGASVQQNRVGSTAGSSANTQAARPTKSSESLTTVEPEPTASAPIASPPVSTPEPTASVQQSDTMADNTSHVDSVPSPVSSSDASSVPSLSAAEVNP